MFSGDAIFIMSKFRDGAFATGFEPHGGSFTESVFAARARFAGSQFKDKAGFGGCHFGGDAEFTHCAFGTAQFSHTTFRRAANFARAAFHGPVYFTNAEFEGPSYFGNVHFEAASFVWATFRRDVNFAHSEFDEAVDFSAARFLDGVKFHETRFKRQGSLRPSVVFSAARFSRPTEAVFYKTDLSRAVLHNCDVSEVVFSDVTWMERARPKKRMVFDEVIPLADGAAAALRPAVGNDRGRNYRLIAELYQQLKRNYDERRDYWTAGDFHFGEMEMRRLHSASPKRWIRWLHKHLGVLALYKHATAYGEDYVRPGISLLLVMVLFGVLYAATGLSRKTQQVSRDNSSQNVVQPRRANPRADFTEALRIKVAALRDGLLTSLEVATFTKYQYFEPNTRLGHLAAVCEPLLTSSLAALFLLALRRQFKR
jgi:uncharacterized protein YjbI with pentapeptide repeats